MGNENGEAKVVMNKKGASSVFLVFILAAMMSLTGAFIYLAREKAVESYSDGLLNLAGNSILSEYNRALKKEYGLFAFYGDEREIQKSVRSYMNFSLAYHNIGVLTDVKAGLSTGSLASAQILEQEIVDYMKYAIAKDLLQKKKEEEPQQEIQDNRVLRNEAVIESLPSAGLRGESGFLSRIKNFGGGIPKLKEAFQKGTDAFLVNRYIITNFKNATRQKIGRNTFFTNEVEYILAGKYDDGVNKQKVKSGLVTLRTTLNISFLYMDATKRSETLALAELMTPGPEAVITQAALIAAWGLGEAENDAALLLAGKKVPLLKDKSSWATNLEGIINGTSIGYIEPKVNKGLTYEGYLMMFLHFQNKGVKLTRTADLMQLNMKGNYDRDFLMRDYYCRFEISARVNGKLHEIQRKY